VLSAVPRDAGGEPGDAITAAQFTGEEAPPSSYFDGLVAAICRRWLEDGKPKAIVRVPPMQGGKSGELVRRLKQTLAGHGARVLDATGSGALDKQRFLSALEADKNRSHAASAFDVMVGVRPPESALDWRTAFVSMPALMSLRATLRLTGSVCLATQTSPMPPSPIFSTRVYLPAMTAPGPLSGW
jgi:hypothetical protein